MRLREEPAPPFETAEEDLIETEDVVDEVGETAGVTYKDGEELACGDKEMRRDEERWELDPASAEDYRERMRHEHEPDGPADPLLHMTHNACRPGHH